MLRPFIVIGFLSGATAAFADPVPLANDDLKATVTGAIVEIDTPIGTTVPMHFGTDGLVSAEAGVLAPVLGAPKDRGRWWVDGDKLCTKWFRWFDAGVRCLTIARDGSRIYWRKVDDGETGTGTLMERGQPTPEPKAPATSTVVAKAEPAAPKKPAAENGKFATRLAGPSREVPREPSAASSTPTTVAQADAASIPDAKKPDDGPSMRFAGAGLLDASAFAASEAPAGEPASTAKAAEPQPRAVASLPAKEPDKAASGKKVQYQAAAADMGKRAPQKRAPTGKDREAAVATSSTHAVALYRVTGVHDFDVLNVRRGPSEEHVSIASIPPTGRQVEITGQCRADWCPIRYGGITGWVNRYYLAEEGSRRNSYTAIRP